MIIVKLIGGLGNQMFQYALGRHLSEKNNVEFKIDISGFESYKLHRYSLNTFNTKNNIASKYEIDKFKKYKVRPGKKWFLYNKFIADNLKYFQEKEFSFNPKVLDIKDNAYIDGYWQSEKYFKEIESLLKHEFTLKKEFENVDNKILETIVANDSVSLHIRRSDYVTREKTNQIHGICSLKYYNTAILKIKEIIKNPFFFVFSDDMPWVKENLKLDYPVVYVDHGQGKNYEDLILMSRCKHNIIANSTFSWWGAWLNENPNKIVIAPKKWFNDESKNTKDLIPDGWITL